MTSWFGLPPLINAVKTKDSSVLRFQMRGVEPELLLAVKRDLGYPELN